MSAEIENCRRNVARETKRDTKYIRTTNKNDSSISFHLLVKDSVPAVALLPTTVNDLYIYISR